jgi:hypothetical protein
MLTISQSIGISSIYFGSLYMSLYSLKELNKIFMHKDCLIKRSIISLNSSIFILSSMILTKTTRIILTNILLDY